MAEEGFAISDEGSVVAKEIVTPEMVDLQLESFDEVADFSGYEWTEREASEADGAHNADSEGSTPSPATNPQSGSEDSASDEDCGCRERVHVESSPGRWIDKMVKRGGCCG